MKEYIEREAVVAFLENMAASRYLIQCFESNEKFPAADVEPVVHGEWKEATEAIGTVSFECIKCSACEQQWLIDKLYDFMFYKEQWAYCPFCGADMRGVHR